MGARHIVCAIAPTMKWIRHINSSCGNSGTARRKAPTKRSAVAWKCFSTIRGIMPSASICPIKRTNPGLRTGHFRRWEKERLQDFLHLQGSAAGFSLDALQPCDARIIHRRRLARYYRVQQVLLGAEMIMHRCQVNSCLCNDMAQGSGRVALLSDEPFRRVQNLFFGVVSFE